MQTLEQAPAADAAVTVADAQAVEPKIDNITGAELVAAITQRRAAGRRTEPAQVEPEPAEEQPAAEVTPETPQADQAAPEDANAASAPEASEEVEPAETEEPAGFKAMRDRIDKLTARLRDAERQLADKGEQAESATEVKKQDTATYTGEFDYDPEMQRINKELTQWRSVESWLSKNPEGGEVNGQVITEEQAEQLRGETADKLSNLRVERDGRKRELRIGYDSARHQSETFVAERFAWAKNPASEENEQIRRIVSVVPELKRLPGWYTLAAFAANEMVKEFIHGKGNGKPKAKAPTPPKVAPPNGATAQRINPDEKRLAEAKAAYEKSGSAKDKQRVMAIEHELRMKARAAQA